MSGTQTKTLSDKVAARLFKFGVTDRKAKEIGKALASASRWGSDGIGEKLEKKLLKLGLHPRKAKELAKALAPTVRAAIKAKAPSISKTSGQIENEEMVKAINRKDDPDLDKIAPRVGGYRVRIDLPTLDYRNIVVPTEVLRVMNGYSTANTYLVAAIGDMNRVIAVRKFSDDSFKLKFYPKMAAWDFTHQQLTELGGNSYLERGGWYERMMFNYKSAEQVLARVQANEEAKMSKVKKALRMLQSITMAPLFKAFGILNSRSQYQLDVAKSA